MAALDPVLLLPSRFIAVFSDAILVAAPILNPDILKGCRASSVGHHGPAGPVIGFLWHVPEA
jgi:hypothetical protein